MGVNPSIRSAKMDLPGLASVRTHHLLTVEGEVFMVSASMRSFLWFLGCLLCAAFAHAQSTKPSGAVPDLGIQPTLYVVGYAHLDTQWRWDYVTTIKDYLPKTMRVNFDWFEKYPHYIFNFSGANRYRLIKEYYPADF